MKVGLFVTCLVDMMRPAVGFSTIELLSQAGCEVVVPDNQTCCGQPGFNSGDRESGRTLAKRFIELFDHCDYVVAPSGSCTGMIRFHYQDLFPEDPALQERIHLLAQRTFELTDFLVNILKVDRVESGFKGSVTYHDSCSGLRELNIKEQPRKLLNSIETLTLKEMDQAELCCGFGGTFSVKLGDIATRMSDNKCHYAQQSGAEVIAGGDLGCLLNIEGRLRRRGDNTTQVKHIAEILTVKAK
ncbi:MAG: Fe-S oxidoreductase [Ferrovum sp. 37-45-19]|uniref:(Fe-S)-binding protein n=1 Tax=Ferrovum sp. JA12 TaxID=1356299 RepID=UPI0007023E9E|nr:(Fe-S)-binding protein [Ferrovum sp. JA12]OYV79799.1 MAG: Fe-S oxidoreductase [Ferrovum sp. 21-44-67]OYV95422.1 MAG: Fe-S oxidoreductase [Ferrovum sp. 37-45-19]OZB31473.1 MAG: Fe-S oxidoreductase [Ferrovum sp. 34-44-207]HQT81215.1 (Fe-S)-binding protein [Ferrovaceae bacterium]KRH78102.1 lactate utilization protein A [Ferrovum sp. JA12]